MSKHRLHGNGRKDCPVYSEHYDPANDRATSKVYRPHSARRVSAVRELNRLAKRIKNLEISVAFHRGNYDQAVEDVAALEAALK